MQYFKDEKAYEEKRNEICYRTELDSEYTPLDFLNEAKGNQRLADETFYVIDGECPEAYIMNLIADGTIEKKDGTYVYLED